jgi:hypothetical protein
VSTGTRTASIVSVIVVTAGVLAGCGAGSNPTGPAAGSGTVTTAAAENNPAGDIPDSQVFVPFTPTTGLFTVSVPEGWARSNQGSATIFTDKLNTIHIETQPRAAAPNTESVTVEELPAVAAATQGYRLGTVTAVQRTAGPAILITYQGTSPPNPVTGKTATDAFERYEFWRDGREVVLTLSSPVGADNVDPWRAVTDSLHWR